MARRSGSGFRSRRQREKLFESGIGIAAIGLALLIAPRFFSNPVLRTVFAGLGMTGWILLVAGISIIGITRLLKRQSGSRPATPSFIAKPSRCPAAPAASSAPPAPSAGPIVADVVSTGYRASAQPVSSAGDAPPQAPAAWSTTVFDVIKWRRFEAVCEWLFAQAGFETKTQSHGADGGIDIWLYSKNFPDGPVSVVQCKHWSTRAAVKVGEVRALLGSMTDKKVERGIFATTSTFTQDARQFAKDNSSSCWIARGYSASSQDGHRSSSGSCWRWRNTGSRPAPAVASR